MIGIYDKGKIDSTFIQNVSECLEQKTTACPELNELRNCKVAIVHVTNDYWNALINDYSCPDSVRIRVSTVGFSEPPAPTISNSNVYEFYLLPPIDNLEAEWKKILTDLSDREIVRALVRGENPNGLRRFFVHEVQEYLSAFTILCEGYLAVHAENTDCSEDISSALELMGWTKFQKSDRYSALIREDLSEQISIVRRAQWWSDVFEPESFDNDVKKEWKDTTGEEEIPKALNNLLEAIRSGESVVPPKIAADAYCVLEKKLITAPSEEWQIRRNKFNHDWLKNKFLNSFNDFIGQLQKRNPDFDRMSEFLKEDFPAWKSERQEAEWIVQSFEDGMSPRRLLSCAPLSGCDIETREWLGHLVHGLWLSRYPVKEKAKESQEALIEVNKMYEKLASELEQSMPIGLTKLISLRPQFCELKTNYKVLSKTLSDLPRYESRG